MAYYRWPEDDLRLGRRPLRYWAFVMRAAVIAAGAGFWIGHLRGAWM
jgi:hypothetical protein